MDGPSDSPGEPWSLPASLVSQAQWLPSSASRPPSQEQLDKRLRAACACADATTVTTLLALGADVNSRDPKTGWVRLIALLLNSRLSVAIASSFHFCLRILSVIYSAPSSSTSVHPYGPHTTVDGRSLGMCITPRLRLIHSVRAWRRSHPRRPKRQHGL